MHRRPPRPRSACRPPSRPKSGCTTAAPPASGWVVAAASDRATPGEPKRGACSSRVRRAKPGRALRPLRGNGRTSTRLRLISPNLSTIVPIRSLGRQSQRIVASNEQLDSRRVRDLYPREQSEKGFVRLGSEIVRTVRPALQTDRSTRSSQVTVPKPTAGRSAGSWCRAERWLIESEGRLMLLNAAPLESPPCASANKCLPELQVGGTVPM